MRLSKPVIAAIDGPCFGGGAQLALGSDISIATNRAEFMVSAGGRWGVPSGQPAQMLLPLVVGWKRAKSLCLMPRTLSADDAAAIGIVDLVVNPDDLIGQVQRIATQLAESDPTHLAITKAALSQVIGALESPMMLTLLSQSKQVDSMGLKWKARQRRER